MKAISYAAYGDEKTGEVWEWHVNFDGRWVFAERPDFRKRALEWMEENQLGACGEKWRISSYANPAYAAFLSEEDAMLFFLAFQ